MFSAAADGHHRIPRVLYWPSSSDTTSASISSSSSSTRSHLSALSTTSSLSSTFSDVSISSIPSPPSPPAQPASKTNAFFASPFSTRPSSPSPPPSPHKSAVKPVRNLTTDFFAKSYTDIVSPTSPTSNQLPPMSRLFPSRFTSVPRRTSPTPSSNFVTLDDSTPTPELDPRSDTDRAPIPTLNLTTPASNTKRLQDFMSTADNEPTPRPPAKVPASLKVTIPTNETNATLESDSGSQQLEPGSIIISTYTPDLLSPAKSQFSSTDAPANKIRLRLVKLLGYGAFSSVWLADDLSATSLSLMSKRSLRELKRKASVLSQASSLGRRVSKEAPKSSAMTSSPNAQSTFFSSSPIDTEPTEEFPPPESMPTIIPPTPSYDPSGYGSCTETPVCLSRASSIRSTVSTKSTASRFARQRRRVGEAETSKLVAVKMTLRDGGFGAGPEGDKEREKTRSAFIREVEVLRHISHPNITALLASFTTSTHHILVLPYLSGGDLLSLVNSDIGWANLGEDVLRRLFCELCKAVGWMHSVGIVHRDIKLENVLLTTSAFGDLEKQDKSLRRRPTLDSLPAPPLPLIKLTDFGLSRFIDVSSSASAQSSSDEGYYDEITSTGAYGSHLDESSPGGLRRRPAKKNRRHRPRTLLSTRCGSEAYAAPELVMGGGGHRGIYDARETDAWACGVVLFALVARELPFGEGVTIETPGKIGGENASSRNVGGVAERRAWLMKIARGEWAWPSARLPSDSLDDNSHVDDGVLVGKRLAESAGAKRMVERLLVRDPTRRANVEDLWDDEWMQGVGVVPSFASNPFILSPSSHAAALADEDVVTEDKGGSQMDAEDVLNDESGDDDNEDQAEEDLDDNYGWLLDEEGIQSIARQEVV